MPARSRTAAVLLHHASRQIGKVGPIANIQRSCCALGPFGYDQDTAAKGRAALDVERFRSWLAGGKRRSGQYQPIPTPIGRRQTTNSSPFGIVALGDLEDRIAGGATLAALTRCINP
jgi:hypothetical protein